MPFLGSSKLAPMQSASNKHVFIDYCPFIKQDAGVSQANWKKAEFELLFNRL
jgi:hypothetical protein